MTDTNLHLSVAESLEIHDYNRRVTGKMGKKKFLKNVFKQNSLTMNFFPNLQIHFHMHTSNLDQDSSMEASSEDQPSGSSSESPITAQMSSWLSQFIRNLQSSSTGVNETDADIHVYMNVDSQSSSPSEQRQGLTLEEMNCATILKVIQTGEYSCAICQNAIDQGTIVQMVRRCEHSFHPLCIQQWLSANQSCPICRTPVLERS